MSNMLKLLAFLSVVILSGSSFAETVIVTEDKLQELAKSNSPRLDEIEAALYSAKITENQLREKYAPELYGRYLHAETRERAIVPFQPIFSPIDQTEIGVRQKLSHGIDTSLAISTDQRSADPTLFSGRFRDSTTTTLKFTVQVDLWRDLLGRMTKAELESANLDMKRAELEREVHRKTFRLSLRRLYWSLVANQESMKVSEQLLKSAETVKAETAQRLRLSVAEADELARYEALVASRQGTLTYLQFQRETLIRQIQNLVPALTAKQLTLGEYDIPKTINEVLACTATIASRPEVPYQYTTYDEIVSLLRENRAQRDILNSRYSDVDVKFFGAAKTIGVSSEPSGAGFRGSYGDSIDDQKYNNRTGFDAGLTVAIPLGDSKKLTEKSRELYDRKRLEAAMNSTDAQVINTHNSFARTIGYLNDVVRAQRTSSVALEKRLKLMRRKYEQARVSVNDLVQDQDALLSSELTTIDVRLQIINTVFDYLIVFPDTPCAFNRI